MNGPDNPQNTFAPMKVKKTTPSDAEAGNAVAAAAQPAKKKQKKASNKRKSTSAVE